jgi:hypothetical protein
VNADFVDVSVMRMWGGERARKTIHKNEKYGSII